MELLDAVNGHGTTLISLYIPKNKDVNEIVSHLRKEKSTCKNIKSDHTRYRVESALEMCIQRLKQESRGGLALFANSDKLFEVETNTISWLYRCDNRFHTDRLWHEIDPKNVIGLVAIDNKDVGFGTLSGGHLNILATMSSGIPGKNGKGGQSQRRYERLREMHLMDYYHRIISYIDSNFSGVEKIVISGPAFTKSQFLDFAKNKMNYMIYPKCKILDGGTYAGEDGLYELRNLILNSDFSS